MGDIGTSKSSATTNDNRATATDNARSQSGTKNVQASDKATVVAVGDGSTLSAGNISAGGAGSTITVGVNPADVSQLIGGLVDTITQANSQQLQAVTDALKPKTEDKSGPGDPKTLLLVTALAVGGWLIAKDK